MKRANWDHLMAWTTVLAIFGTGSVWAGTNGWTSFGPQGGEIEALSVDPHNPRTLYVATRYGGAFQSLDGGARWVKSGAPNTPLVFDPQDPDTIYAIQPWDWQRISITKSTDGGKTWAASNPGLPTAAYVVRIDPLNTSTVYAGTWYGIFKSADGGTNWSSASSGLPLNPNPDRNGLLYPASVRSLVIDPQNPSTLYAVVDGLAFFSGKGLTVELEGGLFKSTDGGGSWNIVVLGSPQSFDIDVLAIDPQNPRTLYVGTNNGILKSADGGAGWSPVNSGLPPFATGLPPYPDGSPYFFADSIVIDPRQPDTVYAAIHNDPFGSRIFKTTNGGASWSDAGSGLAERTLVRSLQIDPQIPATLYAGTSVGVFKSTDGGTRWSAANSGLTAIVITDVAIDPRNANTLYAATSVGMTKSTDGGTNWSPPNSGVARFGSPIAIDPQNTSTVFAPACGASSVFSTCGVLKSTDGGASWSQSWNGGDSYSYWVTGLAIDPQNSNIVYSTTQSVSECGVETLRRTVDGGMSWSHSQFKDMGVLAGCVLDLVVDPQNSGHLYAVFLYGGVFKSTDAGATWNAANSGLTSPTSFSGYSAAALAIDPGSSSTVYAVSPSGVFKSSDGGRSWNPASSGLPDWSNGLRECCSRPRLAVDPQNSARVYLEIAIDGAHHVFQSSDGGASWTDTLVVSGCCGAWVGGLAISSQGPSTLYAATSNEVFAMTFPPEP